MSEHKNQHIVPACYLNGFLAIEKPPEHKDNPHFELGVYINTPNLDSKWTMKGVRNNCFTSSYYYNLIDSEDPLEVEKYLGIFETKYATFIRKITNGEELSGDDFSALYHFMGLMFVRVTGFQGRFQSFINDTVEIMKSYECDSEQLEEYTKGYEELSKKCIVNSGIGRNFSEVGVHFIVNESNVPFVTSDHPVIRRDTHIDEIPLLVGEGHLAEGFTRGDVEPFFFMAITPHIAIATSKMLNPSFENHRYIFFEDDKISLLYFSLIQNQSSDYIVSDRPNPLGDYKDGHLRKTRGLAEIQMGGRFARIYTKNDRYLFEIKQIEEIPDGIMVVFKRSQDVSILMQDSELKTIEILENEIITRFMRDIELDGVNDKTNVLNFAHKIRLGI